MGPQVAKSIVAETRFAVQRRCFVGLWLFWVAVSWSCGGPLWAARPERGARPIDAQQVRDSIEGAVEFLKRQQSPRGAWKEMPGYEGGVSALATLALVNAGVPSGDPTLQRGLSYLRSLRPRKTYTVALQTMALCALEPKRDLVLIQKNVHWLQQKQQTNGERRGAWGYPGPPEDNSNSQFALLALHEAQRVGAKVSRTTWDRAQDYWQRIQNPDGSWGYHPGSPGTGSMTCAGIASLVITSSQLAKGDAEVRDEVARCCGEQQQDDHLERGVAWLGRYFSVTRNPGLRGAAARSWHYYYLYGLERAGRLVARRLMGEHDWYREGAEFLVREQDRFSRGWKGAGFAENEPEVATALALLFLGKGRWPILIGKVKHGDEDWNRHRHDVANLTGYVEKAWEMKLTWQVLDPSTASVEDLLQAPVLLISGSRAPPLQAHADKLRDYIDRGGFLFAEACCDTKAGFEEGFRQLIRRIFPEPEYRLERMRPEHPIWRTDELVAPDSAYAGRLWAVEYGCRTCVVFSEDDLSCYWELFGRGGELEYPPAVLGRVRDANAIGVNVLAYATNREPRGKEQVFDALRDSAAVEEGSRRGVLEVAKLQHGGGCNDAPGALANLLRAAGQGELRALVRPVERLIPASDEGLFRFPLVFMHGRQKFRFTPQERRQLRTYLDRQGTLLADAICASRAFTESFRREMQAIFPEHQLIRVPANHPLFTTQFGGFDIRQVTRREPQAATSGEPLRTRVRQVAPELEAIVIDGRLAVIFSPYDLSCALEKHESLECRGYTREDAARIGLNVIAYTLNQDPAAQIE